MTPRTLKEADSPSVSPEPSFTREASEYGEIKHSYHSPNWRADDLKVYYRAIGALVIILTLILWNL